MRKCSFSQIKDQTVHMAVDTLGHLLALHVTAANEQGWGHVSTLAENWQRRWPACILWLLLF